MDLLSTSICRSCRTRLSTSSTLRAFSTSLQRNVVPPESPVYIDVPSTFQPSLPVMKREKGILPTPRELFPVRRLDKPSKQYLDDITQSPLPKNAIAQESLTELGQYRRRMAQLRKKHVREGLTELHKRKVDTITKMEHRSHARQSERERLLSQSPRIDARLTNNTVPTAMLPSKSSTPIADDLAAAKAQYDQKVANYNASIATKSEERSDALHTLYMNARTFITTEEQLDQAIEEQFDEDKNFRSDTGSGKSMWNKGPPDTIRDMIANSQVQETNVGRLLSNMQRKGSLMGKERFYKDQERMKKIGERLSGGKI